MKKYKISIAVLAVMGMIYGSTAIAAVVINDHFDTYTSQANFEATWKPIGTEAPLSAEWSTAQKKSGTRSVRTPGASTVTLNKFQSRNQRNFTETSTYSTAGNLGKGDRLVWSFNFYDSAPTANPQRNYANLQDGANSGANQLISLGLNNNLLASAEGGNYYMARVLSANSNGGAAGAYFKLNDAGAPLRSAGWHNLRVDIFNDGVGGDSTDYKFYVDNTLSETMLNAGTLRSYDNIRIGSGLSNGSTEAFFDDMYLEYIPWAFKVTELPGTVRPTGDTVNFGIHDQNDPDPVKTLRIANLGTAAMSITGFSLLGTGYSLVSAAPSLIAADGFFDVFVKLDTAIAGTHNGSLSFNTDIPNMLSYSLNLTGDITAAPVPEPGSFVVFGLIGLFVAWLGKRKGLLGA